MKTVAEEYADAVIDLGVAVTQLSDTDAVAAIDRLVTAFVTTPNATWWWEHLREPTQRLHYGPASDPGAFGLECVRRLVGEPSTPTVIVVGPDEHRREAFAGDIDSVVAALGACFAFEYVVFDPAATWAIFDNHHSVIVIAGHPAGLGELDNLRAELRTDTA